MEGVTKDVFLIRAKKKGEIEIAFSEVYPKAYLQTIREHFGPEAEELLFTAFAHGYFANMDEG
jgi:hypothetical protein